MKKISLIVFCLLLGCMTTNNTSLSGLIDYENESVYNAFVQLNESPSQTSLTDENGYFIIDNIVNGDHELIITYNLDSNSFIGFDSLVHLDEGQNDLGRITLLPPGKIFYIEETCENTSVIDVKWKKIHDPAKKYALIIIKVKVKEDIYPNER